MKKKKSKSMYLVLTLLLLLVAGFTTYAIYKTSASGTANVSAANWVVKVIANSTTTNVTGGASNISLGTCPNLLSPGSSCTIPFTVDMTESEVDSILTVGIGNGINQDTLALMNEAGLSLRISDGTNEGYAYLLNYGTTKVLNLVIDWEAGDEDDDNKASADVALSKSLGTLTIPVNMTVRQHNGMNRTITFNSNGGSTVDDINIEDGNLLTLPTPPEKENLSFIGWFTSPNGGLKANEQTVIIEDTELYAHWGYKVEFNSNGGNEIEPIVVEPDTKIDELPIPEKTDYRFTGWYTAQTDGDKIEQSPTITSSSVYYAHWAVTPKLSNIVYFDPVSTNTCSSSTYSLTKIKNGTSTCYKWRVLGYDNNTDKVKLQLDHNIVNTSEWINSEDYGDVTIKNDKGPITALKNLQQATNNWERVDLLNYEYDTSVIANSYGKLSCLNGSCSVSSTGDTIVNNLRARLITAEEILQFVKLQTNGSTIADSWSLTNQDWFFVSNLKRKIGNNDKTDVTGNIDLSWLYENTTYYYFVPSTENAYSSANNGYWTLSPKEETRISFLEADDGSMSTRAPTSSNIGLRPVIEVPCDKVKEAPVLLADKVKLGDYITMTPTPYTGNSHYDSSGYYNVTSEESGYSGSTRVKPTQLTQWRVLRKNTDGTIDIVSTRLSSSPIYFMGSTGYNRIADTLDDVAMQYESEFTTTSRSFGYNGQSYRVSINTSSRPWTESTTTTENVRMEYDYNGQGDTLYVSDYYQLKVALGTLGGIKAYKYNSSSYGTYCLSSRRYETTSTSSYSFGVVYVDTNGDIATKILANAYGDATNTAACYIRPVLTLKSNLKLSGSGTSADPYTLSN